MPLGALVARADLMTWRPGSHASTFGGNPICCCAALVTLDLIEDEYLANTVERGAELRLALEQLASERDCLGEVRGLGLMLAVDAMVGGKPSPELRGELIQAAFHRGLLVIGCGQAAVRFCPALCVTSDEVKTAVTLFDQACDDLLAERE